jgi:hypothetical protein
MFTATLIIIAKLWKQSRCPTTDEWYSCRMEFYSATKKNEFCDSQVNGWN